jgi:hypothetical protein
VHWRARTYVNVSNWEIGIALLPERRGEGLGWRAQALLCDYLFHHTPAQRVEAATRARAVPASIRRAVGDPALLGPGPGSGGRRAGKRAQVIHAVRRSMITKGMRTWEA